MMVIHAIFKKMFETPPCNRKQFQSQIKIQNNNILIYQLRNAYASLNNFYAEKDAKT